MLPPYVTTPCQKVAPRILRPLNWELNFQHLCLILFPGSVVRSELHNSLFLMVSRMWFVLVRLAHMAVSTGLWHRLSNSPPWACLKSFPSKRGGKARSLPGFHFTVKNRPVPGSSGASLAKKLHLDSRTETHPGGKKSACGSVSASSADTRRKGAMGVSIPDVSVLSLLIIFICDFSGCYAFPFFRSMQKHYF